MNQPEGEGKENNMSHSQAVVKSFEEVQQLLQTCLNDAGFEVYPFKVGWYNERVGKHFQLDHAEDTVAFVVISTPDMFDQALKPFIQRRCCEGPRDPVDQCVGHYFTTAKQALSPARVECLHDYEMSPGTRRPRVLVQTAGHVAGAARYYQRSDLQPDPWPQEKSMFGVSMHPRYGGWFALRGVLILPDLLHPHLPREEPPDVLPSREQKMEVLEKFNGCWQDWSFRDVVPVEKRYSEEQKTYFATPPKDRLKLLGLS